MIEVLQRFHVFLLLFLGSLLLILGVWSFIYVILPKSRPLYKLRWLIVGFIASAVSIPTIFGCSYHWDEITRVSGFPLPVAFFQREPDGRWLDYVGWTTPIFWLGNILIGLTLPQIFLAAIVLRRKRKTVKGQERVTASNYTCPCCGFPTLFGRGGFEVCWLCDWEDDGQDEEDADRVRGGPNSNYSLREARGNWELHLTSYRPSDTHAFSLETIPAIQEIKLEVAKLLGPLRWKGRVDHEDDGIRLAAQEFRMRAEELRKSQR